MNIGFDFRMGGKAQAAGIGRYSFELVREMLQQSDHHFYIFFNKHAADREELDELSKLGKSTLVPTKIRHYSFGEQLNFPQVLSQYNIDLMHFPNFNVPILYKGPFVVTIHDLVHHRLSGHKKSRLLHFQAYKQIMKHAVTKSKAIITPSEASKKDIMQEYGIPDEKIKVIYEGPRDLPEQSESQIEKVKEVFMLDRPYFLFVGTLERKKNVVQLAHAFNEFLEKSKLDMDLVIAGKADAHYPEVRYDAMRIPHAERLVFTGFVDDAQLAALYQGAFAYVSASANEGFGLPGVEAMRFGLPLVVANTPVFNEIYDDAAVYFDASSVSDMAAKLEFVARDATFAGTVAVKSAARAEYFSWKKAAKETLAVYDEVMGNKPKVEDFDIIEED